VTDDWLDPFTTDDPGAREREQRRRDREQRRRQRLGKRVGETTAAAEPAPPPQPPPAPATPPPPEETAPDSEAVPPDPEAAPPDPEAAPPDPAPPTDEDLRLDGDGDRGAGADGDEWQAAEPTLPPLPPAPSETLRPSRRTVRRRRIVVGAIVVVLALVIAFLVLLFQPFHGPGHGRINVRIPKGASASEIADTLDRDGVVANSTLFRIRLDLSGDSDQIQAGTYTLALGMSYGDAIDALTIPPKQRTISATIPEGYDRRQGAALARQVGLKGNYLAATRHSKFLDPADYGGPKKANLEGFLFPSTYTLHPGAGVGKLVQEQLGAFSQEFHHVKLSYAKSKNLTPYDVLIIASIVQREAGVVGDFPKVAAVVYNRLHDGMPLQIDATIRFAENNYTKPLTESDLHINSPYNSYEHSGLPPGPISNPGLTAMKAAAHPAHVPYLYYVTKPGACGQLLFASTYAQAQRQQARYNNARAAAGGKSPTKC
jgi:uncharacterized YceG family protein